MKKISTIFLMVFCLWPAVFAQDGKEIIAVYVIGGNNAEENGELGSRIAGAISGGGRFAAIERTKEFAAEADAVKRARPGFKQIGLWGKQHGADYVCFVDAAPVGMAYRVSAHIISAESGNALISVRSGSIGTKEELWDVSVGAVNAMLSVFAPDQQYKRVKFGARAAYNVSHLKNVKGFSARWHDGQRYYDIYASDYDRILNGLNGVEFGLAANVEIWRFLSFNLETNFVYRTPVNGRFYGDSRGDYSLSEYAASFPALFQLKLMGPLFIEAGGQLDIPFNTKLKWDELFSVEIDDRKSIDFGALGGVGWRFGKHFTLNARYIHGLTKFDSNPKHKFFQINSGLQYLF